MKKEIPLIVPEINGGILTLNDKIISNPNCSTIQLFLALKNIHKHYGIKRLVISTYQSVTGTGSNAVKQLMGEREGIDHNKIYPYKIDLNCFPHGGDFLENGYTSEEMKLLNETRKIFNDEEIQVSATVVRIPVIGGHSEAVNIETKKSFSLPDVIELLHSTDGVVIQDDPKNNIYPMPITAHEKNEVFVGRIREINLLKMV